MVGIDPAFKVDLNGETLDSYSALAQLGGWGPHCAGTQGRSGLEQRHGGLYRCRGLVRPPRASIWRQLTLGVHALLAPGAFQRPANPSIPSSTSRNLTLASLWTANEMKSKLIEGSRFIRVEAGR